ncbi:sugar ABC transporter substrate-binding protein [Paenibacillus filicis]|uniref:Sugar ABC transporter substrate-binding protein n=1 Tax=Paenibacillus gyeongsangnamensis TaxID=3388067 RepID=A0ABT4QF36_9BACL|nr:sugar ABC transporter substrate-binding protein [Paenibacillus filicis]MCZ8515483.1 sugar ABC transporter substrate-binding protein [Paenibacillus filicis]
MRKPLSLLVASLMLLTFSGCTSPPASSPSKDSTAGTEASTKKAEVGTTEITMITLSEWDKRGLADVIAGFEKQNPGIKVKLEMYPFRQLFETIEVKLGSKSKEYDIVTVDGPLVSNYSAKGYLDALEPYLQGEDWKNKWIESSIKAGTYNGKQLMAAPMNTSSQVLYYNKDIFEKKGITPPSFDINQRWTWEQVVDKAKQLTYDSDGQHVFGFSFEQIGRAYQVLALAESLGAKSLSDNGITATGFINSDKSLHAAKFYYDLYNTWKVSPKITAEESGDYFASGKVAMFVGGTWNTGKFNAAKLNYGIAPHPYFQGQKVATPTGSWHVGISKFSTKKEAAAKFIRYLTLGEGSKIWFNGNHDLPANNDILKMISEDKSYDAFPNNIYRIAAYEAQNTAVPRPVTPGYLEFETLYNKAYDDIKNGTDPKKALDDVAAQMDRQLKKYERLVK